jgi:hypothetical protein
MSASDDLRTFKDIEDFTSPHTRLVQPVLNKDEFVSYQPSLAIFLLTIQRPNAGVFVSRSALEGGKKRKARASLPGPVLLPKTTAVTATTKACGSGRTSTDMNEANPAPGRGRGITRWP